MSFSPSLEYLFSVGATKMESLLLEKSKWQFGEMHIYLSFTAGLPH